MKKSKKSAFSKYCKAVSRHNVGKALAIREHHKDDKDFTALAKLADFAFEKFEEIIVGSFKKEKIKAKSDKKAARRGSKAVTPPKKKSKTD